MNVPAGQHPPFATITPDDHAAWIIISAALGSSMILLFAAIRAFIRAYISAEHGIDDYLVSAATVRMQLRAQIFPPLIIDIATGLRSSVCDDRTQSLRARTRQNQRVPGACAACFYLEGTF